MKCTDCRFEDDFRCCTLALNFAVRVNGEHDNSITGCDCGVKKSG